MSAGTGLPAGSPVIADSRSRPIVRPRPKFCTSVKAQRRAAVEAERLVGLETAPSAA